MKTFYIFSISVLVIFALVILFFAIKSHKFFKTLLFNSFLGLVALAIIDLTTKFTGVYIPINPYSVIGVSIFGVPAICLILVLQILII